MIAHLPSGRTTRLYFDSDENVVEQDFFEIGETPTIRPGYRDFTEESIIAELRMHPSDEREAIMMAANQIESDEFPILTAEAIRQAKANNKDRIQLVTC